MKNFRIQEFVCHCGCEMPPEARQNIEALVAEVLDPVRDEYGKPIHVNSDGGRGTGTCPSPENQYVA